jgi:hypothetical protein
MLGSYCWVSFVLKASCEDCVTVFNCQEISVIPSCRNRPCLIYLADLRRSMAFCIVIGLFLIHSISLGQQESGVASTENSPLDTKSNSSGEQPPAVFQAGVAAVDITPKPPSIIAGGFLESRAERVNDRLYARSFVLDDGTTRIVLVIVDTCMMPTELVDEAKRLANAQCGIPVKQMMVSATHTHSAPAAMACLGTRLDKVYAASLPGKIAEAICLANQKLQPVRIGWAAVEDWEHTHNRRWIRQPDKMIVDPFGQPTGRAHMHPGYLSPDILGPSGPVDPSLSVVSLRTLDDQPLGVLANYSQHYFGAAAISADYYGHFCEYVAESLQQTGEGNGPFVCALSQGTSGDLMWMDYGSPPQDLSIERYSQAVAMYADKALQQVVYHDHVQLVMVEKELTLGYRVPDEERLAWASEIAAKIQNQLPTNLPEVYAQEALILHERQQTTLKLQAIRVGDLTMATLPNEVYALTGLKLRGHSPAALHFNIELANGAEGYIPPPEQHLLGGYTTWPARTAGLEVQAEPKILETLLLALEEVTGLPRRAMGDHHGPYAQAVLNAKPVGYWRLDDAQGFQARNAIASGLSAEIHPGFAWYLPGAGSGSGIGSGQQLVPSEFSGPAAINRALHLAGGRIDLPLERKEAGSTLACWFWLGEASGASEREGELAAGQGDEILRVVQNREHRFRLELNGALTSNDWPADQWHFACIVYEGNAIRVFMNGSEEPCLQFDRLTVKKSQPQVTQLGVPIGWTIGRQLQGKLDELALFDRCLSTEDMLLLWQASGMASQP